jgi:hypothetical protein
MPAVAFNSLASIYIKRRPNGQLAARACPRRWALRAHAQTGQQIEFQAD